MPFSSSQAVTKYFWFSFAICGQLAGNQNMVLFNISFNLPSNVTAEKLLVCNFDGGKAFAVVHSSYVLNQLQTLILKDLTTGNCLFEMEFLYVI